MRKLQIQPKNREHVPIPEDLRSFIAEVHTLIEIGDEATQIESDDLLQSEVAYGGLLEEGGQDYIFTYFPNHKVRGVRDQWILQFDVEAIKAIANGTSKELWLWACQDEDCGCKFQDPNETCFYCDYIDEIYIALLDEGTEVWRPVEAVRVSQNVYRIISENPNPEDERWEFARDDLVQCRAKTLSNGMSVLVASEKADKGR